MSKFVLVPLRKNEHLDMRTGNYIFPPYDYSISKCEVVRIKEHLFQGKTELIFEVILDGEDFIQFAEQIFDSKEAAEEERKKLLSKKI